MKDLLAPKKDKIIARWIETTMASYPPQTVQFFKKQTDRFSNPVGHTLTSGLNALFQALLGPEPFEPFEHVQSALDDLIRIRSVQDFTSSEAVAFVFALKPVIYEVLQLDQADPETLRAWLDFQSEIDQLGLHAFDTYMKCRDDLAEARFKDVKRRSHLFGQQFQCSSMTAREEEEGATAGDNSLKGEDAQ